MSTNDFDESPTSFYINEPPINPDIETFFANYASISPSSLRDHLVSVRETAWQRYNYPCLGRWAFLHFSIKQNPIYEEIVEQCKNEGATVIDFGCCLGQDVRQLVYDGVPLDRIRGYELDPFFIEQGYELFRDSELMKANKIFATGNIFDDQFLKTIELADYLYAASFLHLFDVETQHDVCRRLSRLAKRAIAGRQIGALVPMEQSTPSRITGSKVMRHSPESFARMWNEATDGEWEVQSATLHNTDAIKISNPMLTFVLIVDKNAW
ncbi:unnamed protein product [Rotaria sp. Silwood2]|nr:unnamed protein product [Rotaria sp. Silwood2]